MTPKHLCVPMVFAMCATLGCGGESTPPGADVESAQPAGPADIREACDLFTLDMARQILGESATRSELAAPFAGSSDDLAGSTCTYEAEDPTPVNQFVTTITASITLTWARTDTGRSSNRSAIEQNQATFGQAGENVETMSGLGDEAYYIGGLTNQMHVLAEDGNWALIASADDPDGDHRAATERLARLMLEQR